jgi:hypothetical protein
MCVGLDFAAARDSMDRVLARYHRQLVPLLDTLMPTDEQWRWRLQGGILGLDSAWLAWRAEDCDLAGAMTGAGGSWPATWSVACEVEETARRIRIVRRSRNCLRALLPKRRDDNEGDGVPECLAPLRLLRASPPQP